MFLGTAGIWRISTINEAGGWKERTTVEDMDLAVRASLRGWEFLYVGDVKVLFPFDFSLNRQVNDQGHVVTLFTCRLRVNFRVLSRLIVTSSTGGLVVLQIYSGKSYGKR